MPEFFLPPLSRPMFYVYPDGANTLGIELQYFYGPGRLVAPVREGGMTSMDVYLSDDVFYDFYTHKHQGGRGGRSKLLVPVGVDGTEAGTLCLDHGLSLQQLGTTLVTFGSGVRIGKIVVIRKQDGEAEAAAAGTVVN
ncbi:87de91c6-7014-41a9-8a67-58881903eaae [Thermothielavioides terrestris]|uniref:87de91c6-7014-41a9-8a67-58881903eaae n=1 Tax=Thermothielavioides terrestris TaxID=2587410 RepID=A0A3S4B8W6_9PEZI|nr:87de91c6-7014-41a9-8a67-58881903eaae [Thermothielavioides terrestris]